jgi:voltage-gated potassium channel
MDPRRKLLISLLILLSVFIVGALGYMVIDHASFLDSLYMTAIVVSTVGLERPTWVDPAGKIWTILIILFGIAAVLTAFSSLQAVVVSGTVRQLMGRRKLEAKIAQLSDHVIICGYGRMGEAVVRDLRPSGISLVVVEQSSEGTTDLDEEGILYVLGDATEEETLLKASPQRAKALVTLLGRDADNVYVTLIARGLNEKLNIIARAESQGTDSKLRRAGADRVIAPQALGAASVVNVLTRPHLVDFVELAAKGVSIEMDRLEIGADSALCGLSLRDSHLRQRAEATVVAIQHAGGRTVYSPGPDEVIGEGDTLVLLRPAKAPPELDAL